MEEAVRERSLRWNCWPCRPLKREVRAGVPELRAGEARGAGDGVQPGRRQADQDPLGIYHPDLVVVLDESLVSLVDVAEGLKPEGILLVNTTKSLEELRKDIRFTGKIAVCDGTGIAWKELGVPITNTTMLGAWSSSRYREVRVTGPVPSGSGSAGSLQRIFLPPSGPTTRSGSSTRGSK